MSMLPTFEEMRRAAHRMLGDVQDELRSDWRPAAGPTADQAEHLLRARKAIAAAKDALNDAAEEGP